MREKALLTIPAGAVLGEGCAWLLLLVFRFSLAFGTGISALRCAFGVETLFFDLLCRWRAVVELTLAASLLATISEGPEETTRDFARVDASIGRAVARLTPLVLSLPFSTARSTTTSLSFSPFLFLVTLAGGSVTRWVPMLSSLAVCCLESVLVLVLPG